MTMSKYYISTDNSSSVRPEEFASLAEALEDFGVPSSVVDEDTFSAWLERVGGYGFIEIDGVRVVEVKS